MLDKPADFWLSQLGRGAAGIQGVAAPPRPRQGVTRGVHGGGAEGGRETRAGEGPASRPWRRAEGSGSVDLLLDQLALLRRAPPCGCLADSDP